MSGWAIAGLVALVVGPPAAFVAFEALLIFLAHALARFEADCEARR